MKGGHLDTGYLKMKQERRDREFEMEGVAGAHIPYVFLVNS